MVSNSKQQDMNEEICELSSEPGANQKNTCGIKTQSPLQNSTSQRGLLVEEKTHKGFLKSRLNLASPSAKFYEVMDERDRVSRLVPSGSVGFRERLSKSFREVNWVAVRKMGKDWIKNPMNMALLAWVIAVAISGAILFMVMIGMLNHAIPKKSQRNVWFEVNNQILNALFTLMCLYQHPHRIYHLVLLCRWKPEDIAKLRKVYCKHATYKPHEWGHMMVVVILLNFNCVGQYASCGLNLGYRRSNRPAIGVAICISVAIGAAAAAGLYTIMSPLGREYEWEMDEEAQDQVPMMVVNKTNNLRVKSLEKRFSFSLRNDHKAVVEKPNWKGGVFDLWDDISLAYLSLFCSFCVFGWNMDRLGFGNMYVHIATFLLLCMAPFWVFNLAALNIDNDSVRQALGLTGIILCIFGLLYGGFWRIQIRKRFNLPANTFCCGFPAVTDCVQWLFCCWCSLAQEVRTGDYYEIVDHKFCHKKINNPEQPELSPLPREGGGSQFKQSQGSPLWGDSSPSKPGMMNSPSPSRFSYVSPDNQLPMVEEEPPISDNGVILTAPVPSLIQRDDNQKRSTSI